MREIDPCTNLNGYAHDREDLFLQLLLPYKHGRYVEIGVWKAKEISNSYLFYEKGWEGLLIEPVPLWCRQIKTARPRDIVVQKACSNMNGETTIYMQEGMTSMDKDWATSATGSMKVPTIRFEDLIKQYPNFTEPDFISIDVEGCEKMVLEGMNLKTFRPRIICIESYIWNPFTACYREWEHLITDNGYKFIFNNVLNRFYVRESDEEILQRVKDYGI